MMKASKRDDKRSRPWRDDGDGQKRSTDFDPPAVGESEGEPGDRWQNLTFLLYVGCVIAAILFIVIASFIKL